MVALHQVWLTHTVATLGTASTAEHIQSVETVCLQGRTVVRSGSGRGPRSLGLVCFQNSGLGVKVVTCRLARILIRMSEGRAGGLRVPEAQSEPLDFALEQSVSTAESGKSKGASVADDVLRILQRASIDRTRRADSRRRTTGVSQTVDRMVSGVGTVERTPTALN
jgi:hypothetical protein